MSFVWWKQYSQWIVSIPSSLRGLWCWMASFSSFSFLFSFLFSSFFFFFFTLFLLSFSPPFWQQKDSLQPSWIFKGKKLYHLFFPGIVKFLSCLTKQVLVYFGVSLHSVLLCPDVLPLSNMKKGFWVCILGKKFRELR